MFSAALLGSPLLAGDDLPVNVGARSATVRIIQAALCVLGFRGQDGKRLATDGIYGNNTGFAVRAFYRAAGWPDRTEVTQARYDFLVAEAQNVRDGKPPVGQGRYPGGSVASGCVDLLPSGAGSGGSGGGGDVGTPAPRSTEGASPLVWAALLGVGVAWFTNR